MANVFAAGGELGPVRWERVGPAYSVWLNGVMAKPNATRAEVEVAVALARRGDTVAAIRRALYGGA